MAGGGDGRRPNPVRWMWYAAGGSLGPQHREWVLYDLTGPTRWPRQLVRAVVPLTPFAVLLLVFLGNTWMTWASLAGGLAIALIYSAAYIDQAAEHRLLKHGYPLGTAAQMRQAADPMRDAERIRRYAQTYRDEATD